MITTKTGDKGTSHFLGKKYDKDSPLLEAIGTLDEVQALMAINDLNDIAQDIYEIMATVAYGSKKTSYESRVMMMEEEIDKAEDELPRITNFLIFKNEKARSLNYLRTVVRRAERKLVALNKAQPIDLKVLIYINRLSDYLFVLARRAEEDN